MAISQTGLYDCLNAKIGRHNESLFFTTIETSTTAVSPSWRYGWLLLGVVGLMLLVNWPEEPPGRRANLQAPSAEHQNLAEQQARNGALQEPWLDALWQPKPTALGQLLAEGMDPDSPLDELQSRPLHLLFIGEACRRTERPTRQDTLTSVDLLLAAGAVINAADGRGNTPLMLAVSHCDGQVIKKLIAAGADPDRVNSRGLTAFEMTLSNPGDAALELLESGFRLDAEKLASYREIYADEPEVMAVLNLAAMDAASP
jgi:hypothetical protein